MIIEQSNTIFENNKNNQEEISLDSLQNIESKKNTNNQSNIIDIILIIFSFLLLFFVLGYYSWYTFDTYSQTKSAIFSMEGKIDKAENLGFNGESFKSNLNNKKKLLNKPENYLFSWKIEDLAISINTLDKELGKSYDDSFSAKKNELSQKILDFKKNFEDTNQLEYQSKDKIREFYAKIQTLDTQKMTFEQVNQTSKSIETTKQTLTLEVDVINKEALFNEIKSTLLEVEDLKLFFTQRSGYTQELNVLQKYTEKANDLLSDNYKNRNSFELRKIVESELYSLLNIPRETKMAVIQREELERIERMKQQQLRAGIPQAPVVIGKMILVDIASQRLYAYENGVSIFEYQVPVTTGKTGFETVRGTFSVKAKFTNWRMTSPFPGIYYDNVVSFWMPFYEGYGLHDAPWRYVYGTQDYPVVGSHGCVNIPYSEVERLYYWAEVGTTVIVR